VLIDSEGKIAFWTLLDSRNPAILAFDIPVNVR